MRLDIWTSIVCTFLKWVRVPMQWSMSDCALCTIHYQGAIYQGAIPYNQKYW